GSMGGLVRAGRMNCATTRKTTRARPMRLIHFTRALSLIDEEEAELEGPRRLHPRRRGVLHLDLDLLHHRAVVAQRRALPLRVCPRLERRLPVISLEPQGRRVIRSGHRHYD